MKATSILSPLLLAALAMSLLPPLSSGDDKNTKYQYPSGGKIERLKDGLDKLLDKDAKVEKLSEGYEWSEGPVWVKRDGGFLLFSDIPNNRVMKWQEGKGATVFMKPSGYTGTKPRGGEPGSNGLILDPEGRLILCEHGDRRVARLDKWDDKEMKKTTLAAKYEGKRLNSPNDAVYKSNGDLYFTDPPYGLEKNWDDPARELDFCGVYRLTKDGKLTALVKDMSRPNGIAFSPDEKTLYVANSDPDKPIWMAFPVKEDGTLGKGKVFFDAKELATKERPGLPDGMKVDKDGNLFATGPGGVLILSPDGTHLGTILTGTRTANCNWGDDGTVLYITAEHRLLRVHTKTKGKGW
jgi:gluconolactonase